MWLKYCCFIFLLIYGNAAPIRNGIVDDSSSINTDSELKIHQRLSNSNVRDENILFDGTGASSSYESGNSAEYFDGSADEVSVLPELPVPLPQKSSLGIFDMVLLGVLQPFPMAPPVFTAPLEPPELGKGNNAAESFYRECSNDGRDCRKTQPKEIPLSSPEPTVEPPAKKRRIDGNEVKRNDKDVLSLMSTEPINPPEVEKCYFAEIRRTSTEKTEPRSAQAEVSTHCSSTNLIRLENM